MAFVELDGYPIERNTYDDYCPEREGKVPWATRQAEAMALVGQEYPYQPGCTAYPSEIIIRPMGAQTNDSGSSTAIYDYAIIHVKYSIKRAAVSGTNNAVIEWMDESNYSETVSLDGCTDNAENPLDGRTHHVVRAGAVLNHVRTNALYVPNTVLSSVDGVNAGTVYATVIGIWFAGHTLWVRTPTIKRVYSSAGTNGWYVHQKFTYCYNGGYGWNGIRKADGNYSLIYKDGSPVYPHPPTSVVLV
jgi:hypothetical protein